MVLNSTPKLTKRNNSKTVFNQSINVLNNKCIKAVRLTYSSLDTLILVLNLVKKLLKVSGTGVK